MAWFDDASCYGGCLRFDCGLCILLGCLVLLLWFVVLCVSLG